jgi:radical SAM protein with 4Fe4S-binding SPASM domain
MCPRDKLTRKLETMPFTHFRELVRQSVLLGAKTISIFGYGEPLLDQTVVKKVEYCSHMGLGSFITTNASMLNTRVSKALLKAGLRKIRFSVHGFYENYDRVHKGLNFSKVTRNITNFAAINKVNYSDQCDLNISVIQMNGENVDIIRDFWPENTFNIEVWKPHNWVDGRAYRGKTLNRKKTCGRPHLGPVQINADGEMMVCCFDYNAEMTVGNTYKNTIEEILKGRSFKIIRNRHEKGEIDGLPCESCDQLNIGDNPLIYSSVDESCSAGKTSSTKFNLEV